MKIKIAGLALLVLVGATLGYAQYYPYSYHASTPGEGYARGMADVIRSRGQAAYMDSAAAVNMTVADRNALHNQLVRTKTFFEMRRVNREARAAENPQKPRSKEYWIRLAQEGKPRRLSPGELNTVTGVVAWPTVLQGGAYAKDRAVVQQLFAKRAATSVLSLEEREEVDHAIQRMTKRFNSQIRAIPTDLFVASQQFLKSLAYEVRFPAA